MSEEKSKERLIFEEKIEKLRSRLDSENFEKIEEKQPFLFVFHSFHLNCVLNY